MLSEHVCGHLFPQFATHNAHTVASLSNHAKEHEVDISRFEFQRLHGMGDALYNTLMEQQRPNVRIYAPVGSHKDLLPYLVRRLLENGANSSFVHRLVDARTPIKELVEHPAIVLKKHDSLANDLI